MVNKHNAALLVEKSKNFSPTLQDTGHAMGLNVSWQTTEVQNLIAELPEPPVQVGSRTMDSSDVHLIRLQAEFSRSKPDIL